ncbi:uncharacterized protein LOC110989145 isoform X2 [Acanthaster planci]|uniref:Uncharacterized protein LOC110989145 isoform X2 n=1 Tax=Acanthaster planci TaxID=133434 RepID=A0A8B7ZZI8_ACAPL|nr:uncharacterized protein LOC110989145 isoform X2 [Acanthaster planci]
MPYHVFIKFKPFLLIGILYCVECSVVSKIEIPGLPDVSTNVPLRGKAFCQAHCTVAEKSDIPTGIHEFLKHCGVQVADTIKSDTQEGRSRTHLDVEDRDSTHVDESEEELECLTDSPVEGTLSFIEENSQQMPAIMAGCEEENPMSCRKDTGGRKSLQKWSRGHLFIVCAGGHIEYWQSLYRSESPSQVFLILLAWLAIHLKGISPTEWGKLSLVYDNMCHLDNMRVARKPLPLPWPWSHMWMLPKKCIDRLHIRSHTDDGRKAKYHPDNHLVTL